jgi:hypothetical protein
VHARLAGRKRLDWIDKATQTDFYDVPEYVRTAADLAAAWFEERRCKWRGYGSFFLRACRSAAPWFDVEDEASACARDEPRRDPCDSCR